MGYKRTPNKENVQETLSNAGLTVMLTKDYNSVMYQLASLSEFKNMIIAASRDMAMLEKTVRQVLATQKLNNTSAQLEIEQIPAILAMVNSALYAKMYGESE